MKILKCPKCHAALEVYDDNEEKIICPRCKTWITK